ncbi:MAG TPA: SdpI family protein [Gemmatimonadales bacterium]|nr:SdpI family protein [Gemmatimonadales bacterium]
MRRLWPSFIAFGLAVALSVWAYPRLPAQVATHWGIEGQADGWSSPLVAVLIVPVATILLAAVMLAAPQIDPRRESWQVHGQTYWRVVNMVICFFLCIHLLVIGEGLGWGLPVARLVPMAVGGLLVLIGNLLPRLQPNWFMGIRTPWTLSSDDVWRRTHRLGGAMMVIAGLLLAASGFVARGLAFTLVVILVAFCVLVPVVYSWVLWRRATIQSAGAAK